MPYLLKHLDEIAREKQRDVLSVMFGDNHFLDRIPGMENDGESMEERPPRQDFKELQVRKDLIAFLDENRIGWEPCGDVASENVVVFSYDGQLYIDLPFDEALPDYQKVREFLEHPDGTMRFKDATFVFLPLDKAMKNAHHDAPGFWENWAENF